MSKTVNLSTYKRYLRIVSTVLAFRVTYSTSEMRVRRSNFFRFHPCNYQGLNRLTYGVP
jgi:hypothetical protein